MDAARKAHLAMVESQRAATADGDRAVANVAQPRTNPLNASWQPVGPNQIASQSFGNVTGRVTSIAIDPSDATGNTVYVGTTGGGVWKSTNAAGAAGSVSFVPLTDTLPVFSANAGTAALPSLSIGAVSVANGVVLAGTGDTNDASDSYYGEGLLRSADGGLTWTLIQQSLDGVYGNHSFVGLGVAGFAWSSTTPNLVVAALSQAAEAVPQNAVDSAYTEMGLYYSTDAGVTWHMASIMDGTQATASQQPGGPGGNAVTAVVWNAQRRMFYAAVRAHGYYGSGDGITWMRLANQPGTGLTVAACPPSGNGTGCPIFRGALAVQASTGDTFALSVDWSNRDQGLWQDVCGLSGTTCAVSPIVWGKQLTSTPLEVGSGSTVIAQADYNLSLSAVATGTGAAADTLLFAGTLDVYRCSLAAGCLLRNTTNAENGCAAPAMVAPAQHALATLPAVEAGGTLPLLYIGNDGGLWRSTDGVNQQQTPCSPDDATHFQNLNGGIGSLAEVVSFAQNPTDPETLLVGLGANGTAATGAAASGLPWPQISAGEGGTVAIDQTNPQNWYVSTAAGVSIRYCSNGSNCSATSFTGMPTIGYTQASLDASLIDPPFLLDPALGSDVMIGTCRVWRGPAESGSSWPGSNAISAIFGGPQNAACSAATNAFVRSLGAGGPASGVVAAQNAGSTVLYAGLAGSLDGGGNFGGHLFANYVGGSAGSSTAWTDVSKSTVTNDVADAGKFNPGGFDLSSVVADPHDATGMTVYATSMGFSGNGLNAPHVYRSTNGGASWTNISSNLPGAPANALMVDPNDANTLYVAMDTGVYATTAVGTCTSANCWSVFGAGLPNSPVMVLAASAGISTGDGRFGELRAATYGRGIWEIPLLTAAAPAVPVMTLKPASLTFATQAVSTASAAQTITVTNTGNASLTVSQVAASGDFTETDTCAGTTVAVSGTCTVQVEFLPTATGTRSGVLTVYGNVAGGQATVALTGTGAPPAAIILNPITMIFGVTNVGATSAVQNLTISNTGGVSATIGTPAVTGDFVLTANTCGPSLGPSVGCTVSIAFRPTASGTRTGSFSISDSVGTQTASLSGTGVLPATDSLAPLALTFAVQQLNTASASQAVVLTNAGDAALTLIAAQIASGDFAVVNGCGNSLNGHSTCSLLVTFVPTAIGTRAGTLIVSDQFRSQTVTLSGVGVAPAGVSLSPVSPIAFAATPVGSSSAAQTVTLTNNGGLPLTIQSLGATGDFGVVAGSNTCGASLAAGAACMLQIAFTPTVAGVRAGVFSVVDNAAGSPQSLQLTGTGVDFALNANGPTTATITAGGSATYPLLLTSVANVPGTVTFTCGPVPAHATCTVVPATPSLGGTTVISVTVATSVAGVRLIFPWERQTVWFVAIVPLGLLARRRRPRWMSGMVALLCVALAGCGASRLIPLSDATSGGGGTTATPTPSGTYNLVVAGTSAGLTRSVNLTLVVQ
jgi:Abnormal spindle-like microcephaly-assoc'd, ASPM-SPD-2-Hydin